MLNQPLIRAAQTITLPAFGSRFLRHVARCARGSYRQPALPRILILLLLCLGSAQAFEVSPLIHRLDSIGRGATSTITVSNNTGVALPVEFNTYELQYIDDAIVRGPSADDDLLVFPPSVLLAAGAQQAVRLHWLGDPAPAIARSYLVAVEQIPLPDEPGESGVRVLLSFNVVVHVSPPRARPELVVLSHRIIDAASAKENATERDDLSETTATADGGSSNSEQIVELTVQNRGNGHAFGSLMSVLIRSPQDEARIPAQVWGENEADLFFPPN